MALRLHGLALALVACAALSACATKPKPSAALAATDAGRGEAMPPMPGAGTVASAPRLGLAADFAAQAGDRVYFALDSHDLSDDARAVLDAQAQWLGRHPEATILLAGNADERGTREYNLALGARRANAVRDYLGRRGVSVGRLQTISYGKERPVDARSSEDGWAVNRNAQTVVG